jgi:hypothetical protein
VLPHVLVQRDRRVERPVEARARIIVHA